MLPIPPLRKAAASTNAAIAKLAADILASSATDEELLLNAIEGYVTVDVDNDFRVDPADHVSLGASSSSEPMRAHADPAG